MRGDGSSEHEAVTLALSTALEATGSSCRCLEYPVWALWNPRRLLLPALTAPCVWRVGPGPGDLAGAKARAIAAHRSQVLPLPPDTAPALPPGFADFFRVLPEFYLERPRPAAARAVGSLLPLAGLAGGDPASMPTSSRRGP